MRPHTALARRFANAEPAEWPRPRTRAISGSARTQCRQRVEFALHFAWALGLALAAVGSATPGAAQQTDQAALTHGAPWQAEIYTGYLYKDDERQGRPQWDMAHRCGGSYIAPH